MINMNISRKFTCSEYNKRRSQCEKALGDLQTELSIDSLGQLTKETFDNNQHLIKDDVDRKRAKHAVYENARTLEALEKLQQGDLRAFGQLMYASHDSLKNDYE